MGVSSGYCFKIIACGSNSKSVDRDDLDASSENKGSDKRGWSFRKRSGGNQVLSNTVITETSYSVKKSSEPVIVNSEAPIRSVSEKTYANQWTEELPRVSASTTKSSTPSNLVIEAAADEDEIKLDSSSDESFVIIIQAAVRKFLAQRVLLRHKKTVKLQAAVRGHLVRCRAAGSLRCIQAIIKMQTLVRARYANLPVEKTSIGKEDSRTKPHPTYISIEKLLSNRFVIQLLESTPRTKQINIKCSPTNDDSAWQWLERWTSVSSPQLMESHASKHQQDKVIDTKNQIGNMISEQKPDCLSDESKHLNTGPEVVSTSIPGKHLLEAEQPKRPAKRAFIEAHSRFEELTSKNNSFASVGSSNHEHVVKSPTNSIQPRYVDPGESLVYESLKVGQSPPVRSECGTELSVTSTLDSPDQSEIEYEKESKNLDKEACGDIKSTESTYYTQDPLQKHDRNTDISQVKQSYEDDTSKADIELEPGTGGQAFNSPRTHVTAPESHETPSSQKSKNKSKKLKSWSNSKKSPVSSGSRNDLVRLPRERKPTKRRNSFGSESSDQEPRDSSCSNSIPSYMQVTESARAKALANSSPRSSPDVQGYIKKRHSLPGAVNGRHGSARVKQTSPQAQLTTKGNNNPERKWQN